MESQKCPSCKNTSLRFVKNKKSLSNPVFLKCNKKTCRKKVNIRENTFFNSFRKIPISVCIKIIELFIIDNKNALQIEKSIKDYYQVETINSKLIYGILLQVRKFIAQYFKEIYITPMVEPNKGEYIAVDESLFCHTQNNEKIWLIGLVNTRNKQFRIEAVKRRDSDILQKIIKQHVGTGNNIVTDGWGAYGWMNAHNSGYNRIIHIHGHHDFGYGEESTSHVESVWGDLKQKLSSFYVAVKPDNFIYFAKEVEWRKKVSQKSNANKLKNLQEIFIHISNSINCELFEKELIEDYEKEDYEINVISDEEFPSEEQEEEEKDL